MLKTKLKKIIEVQDWDELVEQTYGKIYSFQQQDGCKSRGTVKLTVPCNYTNDDEMNDSIPEIINGKEMGVKFKVWLERDSTSPLITKDEDLISSNYYWGKNDKDKESYKTDPSHINLFWERNFYPDVYTLANDLYSKGLIEAGDYLINIDW